MKELSPQINLVSAWVGLLLGFASGALMGMKFHQPDWLGGYASFPRRMIRLGHISFFGLGMVNLMFYFVARSLPQFGPALVAASWLFIVGAVTMPLCCALLLRGPVWRNAFAVPVLSLLVGAGLTLWKIVPL